MKYKNKNSGFTLMETMVAVFILLLAITGPMVFAQNGLRTSFLARDQMTAFFLAQDAIEYIKNYRDGNTIDIVKDFSTAPDYVGNPGEWLGAPPNDLLTLCSDGCSMDTSSDPAIINICTTNSVVGCLEESDPNIYTPIYYDETEQRFTLESTGAGVSNKKTIFAREVKLREIQPGKEVEVTVIVRWKSHEGVGVREVVVKEHVFNWADAMFGSI